MKRLFAIILCCLLCSAIMLPAHATETTDSDRYGFTTLTQREQYVYNCLLASVAECADTVTLDRDKKVTVDELLAASEMLCSDWPEYFWYMGTYQYKMVNNEAVTEVYPEYSLNGQKVNGNETAISEAKTALHEKSQEILSGVTSATAYDQALQLHDAVLRCVTYTSGSNDQSAYGALVEGNAVCAGYVRAYQYLLSLAGIRSFKVDGVAMNAMGTPENHSWLLMWLDGECVYTDVTWDDPGDTVFHAYFALSLKDLSVDHTADAFFAPRLPLCSHENMDYFSQYQGAGVCILTDDTDPAAFSAEFVCAPGEGENDKLSCAVRYDGENFSDWFNENRDALAKALNLVGQYQCGFQNAGREYQILFTGKVQTPTQPTQTTTPEPVLPDEGNLTTILMAIAGGLVLIVIVVVIAASGKKKK